MMETLPLSGIQHFAFCPRQWWLIHVGREWMENHLTADGSYMHATVDKRTHIAVKKSGIKTINSLLVCSTMLGFHGICDIVELHESPKGEYRYKGNHYSVVPVEYKHGSGQSLDADMMQVVAYAICLEETLHVHVRTGKIFYFKTRSTHEFAITDSLRDRCMALASEMHDAFTAHTPMMPSRTKGCAGCAMKDLCMPALRKPGKSREYIKRYLYEEDT